MYLCGRRQFGTAVVAVGVIALVLCMCRPTLARAYQRSTIRSPASGSRYVQMVAFCNAVYRSE